MNKNILVTGGAGYVGSHVCKTLHENGFVPITFDNLSTGHLEFVKWGPIFKGDLLNPSDIKEVFDRYNIESVMHLAAKAYVNESMENPIKYYRENIQASVNLLEIFIEKKGKAFVFSSSCATYGNPDLTFISESTLQDPINPYGFTKLATERLIIDLSKLHSFNYSILRYFNAAGADMDLEIGERHSDETHVIPSLINAALTKGTFKIFGENHATPDGTAIRDYIHVTDIAIAHSRALDALLEQKQNIVCNLGTSKGVSVIELVELIKNWRSNFKIQFEERRKGDPSYLVAANTLSKNLLRMEYNNSDINSIVNSAIKWHEKDLED